MTRKIIDIIIVFLCVLIPFEIGNEHVMAKVNNGNFTDQTDHLFIKCEISDGEFYVRQGVFITIWLYSKERNIAYVNEKVAPYLKRGEFSYISKVDNIANSRKEKIGGDEFWVIPVAKYLVMLSEKGKYELKGGTYSIGLNIPVAYNDPFWGPIRKYETRSVDINMEERDFKVKELPKVPSGFPFTGAVGDFSIKTVVPPGDIIINEEATVLINLRGKGFIGNDIMPEYREAFGKGNKLKSVSQKDDMYFDGKDIISDKVLECEFIPESRKECEIGVVKFGYFNPYTGKYEVAESKPVKIKVESSTVNREAIEI